MNMNGAIKQCWDMQHRADELTLLLGEGVRSTSMDSTLSNKQGDILTGPGPSLQGNTHITPQS